MATKYLPDEDHVVRHISSNLVIREDGILTGCFPHAFELRPGEKYLSASWKEYFDGNGADCLAAVAEAMSRTRSVKRSHAFAIGNVGEVKSACREFDVKIRVSHEPDGNNPSYTAIRGFRSEELRLLELLTHQAWSRVVEAGPYLDRCGPWRPRPRDRA